VLVEGVRPVRVLVAGAGLAAGYGVDAWVDSMAGSLAVELARGTRRGVRVDVRAAPVLPARNAVDKLGPNGAYSYDAVVFAPCYLEASISPGAGVARHAGAIQQHLLDTGGTQLRHVLMLGIPRPSKFSRLNLAAAEAATITNRALRDRSAEVVGVGYVEPPPFATLADDVPFDRGYYSELGAQVAASLESQLQESKHTYQRSDGSDSFPN
jgi:hypothetical protein